MTEKINSNPTNSPHYRHTRVRLIRAITLPNKRIENVNQTMHTRTHLLSKRVKRLRTCARTLAATQLPLPQAHEPHPRY